MKKTKSILNFALKLAVAFGLIYFLIRSGHLDPRTIWELMTPVNIAIGLVLIAINIALAVWRWLLLLKTRGFNLPFSEGGALYLIGSFFNYALPGAVSGDLVRGYYLVKDHPSRRMDSVLSVLIDRVLGLYSYFVLSLVAVAVDYDFVMSHDKIRLLAILCAFVFFGLTAGLALGFSPMLYRKTGAEFILKRVGPIHKVMQGLQRFGQNPRILAVSVLVSIIAQVSTLVFFYLIGVAMGEEITWTSILFSVPMGFVVTAVPIAPAGVGVGQVAFLYLFQTYLGRTTQFGSVGITAFQLASAVWSLLGVFFYLKRRKPHEFDRMEAEMAAT